MLDERLFAPVNIQTGEMAGTIGPLPNAIATWDDAQVLDLTALDPVFGLADLAFWRATITTPDFDRATQALSGEIEGVELDAESHTAIGTYAVRDLTPEEIAAQAPPVAPAGIVGTRYEAVIALDDEGMLESLHAPGIGATGIMEVAEIEPGNVALVMLPPPPAGYTVWFTAPGLVCKGYDIDRDGGVVGVLFTAEGVPTRPTGDWRVEVRW
jgi:hypothetical protein